MVPLRIGSVVEVDRGLYRHCGLFAGWRDGVPLVLANLPEGTRIQTWADFARGRSVSQRGYPGRLRADQVLARAQSVMARQYSWLSWNCEHFVNYAHGLKEESPQVAAWVVAVGILGLAITASRG